MTDFRSLNMLLAAVASLLCSPAIAQEAADHGPWTLAANYTVDVAGPVDGAGHRAGRMLDNLDVVLDGDLDRAIGWSGATAHLYLLNNSGGAPNDLVGSLQGVDNIEVGRPRARLYEAWIQQSFAGDRASVLAGLYDLNSEFYANEAAGLLIAPPFGIGSELASTGPNGPSIFPSTALAIRLKISGARGAYGQVAALNAEAATFGDPGGPATRFRHGALLIAEIGVGDSWRLAGGAWRYTRDQPDIRDIDLAGDPALSDARGGYVLAEYPLREQTHGGPAVRLFLRAGLSDGETTPFRSGWQAGVLAGPVFAARPDSALSLGLQQGLLSKKQRANTRDQGLEPARSESSLELTYSDRISPRLTLQPDLQVIHAVGGVRGVDTVVVAALRLTVALR